MKILLSNDDGVHAPGLIGLESQLCHLGEVMVVAPITEQSGVGHSITYLTPLVCKKIVRPDRSWAWAVNGSPADSVKLGIAELCPWKPDIVVSGINSGLNAGINVLYSGTVAAAIEGAFFGVTSFAISLEFSPNADVSAAAVIARNVIQGIMQHQPPPGSLFNINIPLSATESAAQVRVVSMGLAHYGDRYEKRQDPSGRDYYWATWNPPAAPPADGTDITELLKGFVTVTPLQFDLTQADQADMMKQWDLRC